MDYENVDYYQDYRKWHNVKRDQISYDEPAEYKPPTIIYGKPRFDDLTEFDQWLRILMFFRRDNPEKLRQYFIYAYRQWQRQRQKQTLLSENKIE